MTSPPLNVTLNRSRRRALWLTLLATLTVTAWTYSQSESDSSEVVMPTAGTRRVPTSPNPGVQGPGGGATHTDSGAPPPAWHHTPRRAWFAGHDAKGWGALPPMAAPPAVPTAAQPPTPPPPLQAPTFPYLWIGVLDDGKPRAVLANEGTTLAVTAGELIDGTWRVDVIGESSLQLTWLPGQQVRTLSYRNPS